MTKVDNEFSIGQYGFRDRIVCRILYVLFYFFKKVDIGIGNFRLIRWYVEPIDYLIAPDLAKRVYGRSVHFMLRTKNSAYRWSFHR